MTARVAAILVGACLALGVLAGTAAPQGGLNQWAVSFVADRHPVTGIPYCANQESETTRTLADGTNIITKSHMRICRDSQGRERRDSFEPRRGPDSANAETPVSIFISDPVEGVIYFLIPELHTAQRLALPKELPPLPNPNQAPSQNPAPSSDLPPQAPRETAKEQQGSQMMGGVLVEGSRVTRTLPAGAAGNDRPIDSVEETWTSRDLGVILSKSSDPLSGETVQRLTDIDRSEPDPGLFQVPADYKIEDPPPQSAK